MDWIKLALIILELIEKLIDRRREQGLLDAGREMEIAKASANILRKTTVAKMVREEINALSDKELDDLLKSLEPGGVRDEH